MSENPENGKIELLVMLKSPQTQNDVAEIASSVEAQLVEIKTMFGNKIVALMIVEAKIGEVALARLRKDSRVELAQINRSYKHC